MLPTHARVDVFTCAEEDQAQLFDYMMRIAQHLESVDECLYFIVSKEDNSPTRVWVTELWTSQEAHDGSLADAPQELLDVIQQALQLVSDDRQRAWLTPVLAKGV